MKAKKKWENSKQGKHDVRAYAALFSRRLRRLNHARGARQYGVMDSQSVMEQFCDRIESEKMRDHVMLNQPKDFEEAKKIAMEYEKKVYRRSKDTSSSSTTSSSSSSSSSDRDFEEERKGKKRKDMVKEKKKTEEEKKKKGRGRALVKEEQLPAENTLREVKKEIEQVRTKAEERASKMDKSVEELVKGMSELRIAIAQTRDEARMGRNSAMEPSNNVVGAAAGGNALTMNRFSNVTCYNCQEQGHMAPRCPNPPKCRRCGKGHRTANHDVCVNLMQMQEDERAARREDFQ